MKQRFGVISAAIFALLILGVSILQVREVIPGSKQETTSLKDSELGLYLQEPNYFLQVLSERIKQLTLNKSEEKGSYLLYLSEARYRKSIELFDQGSRHRVAQLSFRKALQYQTNALKEIEQIASSEAKLNLVEEAYQDSLEYQRKLHDWKLVDDIPLPFEQLETELDRSLETISGLRGGF